MKTIIIENDIHKVRAFDKAGVDRIMVDLEVLNKKERQGHLNTVISNHTIQDVKAVSQVINKAKLLVRVNPINRESRKEINRVVELGTDIIMLPMFKTVDEVTQFISFVDGRAKTSLLLETSQALCRIDKILEIDGIDEIHIGLNDLHLSLGLDFMFELLTNGIVEYLVNKIRAKNIPFGIGGVARINDGTKFSGTPVIIEHIRLGSSVVILSRRFKQYFDDNPEKFSDEIQKIHDEVVSAQKSSAEDLNKNKILLNSLVEEVVESIRRNKNV